MTTRNLSPRLAAIVAALPLRPGQRVLEIGGGPGTAARAVAARLGQGHVLMIDRSAKSVGQAEKNAAAEIAAGTMSVRRVAVEDFVLNEGEESFDLAFAVRVGAFDGRHPAVGVAARQCVADALVPGGQLFIDGGHPLRRVDLPPRTPE